MIELGLERELTAGRERVWTALTQADALAAWFWPARLQARASTEPRVGGAFQLTAGTTALGVSGRYTLIEPPDRLAWTWRWDGDDTETLVMVELAAAASTSGASTSGAAASETTARTGLRLTHAGFVDEADRANHITGWTDCLDRLTTYLESGPSEE